VVLLWCYSGVTVVLQWCYSGVAVVLLWCYRLSYNICPCALVMLHTQTQIFENKCLLTHTNTNMCGQIFADTNKHKFWWTHVCLHTHCKHMLAQIHREPGNLTYTNIYAHAHTHTHTYTHTHIDTHTHIHTHTLTHTSHALSQPDPLE
jgi:hypothetical protein